MKRVIVFLVIGLCFCLNLKSQTYTGSAFKLLETSSYIFGRNNDPTIKTVGASTLLRLGSEYGVAIWGDGNVNKNDEPSVIVYNDRSFWTHDIRPLKGTMHIIEGYAGDPTIKITTAKWLRLGSPNGIAFYGTGKVDEAATPDVLMANGKVNIGTVSSTPFLLNVGGGIYTESNGVKSIFAKDIEKDDAWLGTTSNHGLYLGTNGHHALYVDASKQNIYVGLTEEDAVKIKPELKDKYKLFVGNGVLSEDFSIAPKSSWSDFVFSNNYKLKDIEEVAAFITENKHLPDVPSASDVAENGYSQHDMNKVLLQKIEELTLYIIDQQKKIEALEKQFNE